MASFEERFREQSKNIRDLFALLKNLRVVMPDYQNVLRKWLNLFKVTQKIFHNFIAIEMTSIPQNVRSVKNMFLNTEILLKELKDKGEKLSRIAPDFNTKANLDAKINEIDRWLVKLKKVKDQRAI